MRENQEQDALLELHNVSVSYSSGFGEMPVIHNVGFSLRRGEVIAIVGESGSGKSTVLKGVQGILGNGGRVSQGKILFNGRDLYRISAEERRQLAGTSLAMVFQNAAASFCPIRTVGEQIYESVFEQKKWSRKEFRERARVIMEHIHLPEAVLDEYPFRLSGGMGQRAGILAAVILEPQVLLADEPTSALDTVNQVSVVKELMALKQQRGIAIIIVTHHMGVAWYMADRVLIMRKGEVVEYGTKEQIFNCPQNYYTRELIAAVPRFDNRAC